MCRDEFGFTANANAFRVYLKERVLSIPVLTFLVCFVWRRNPKKTAQGKENNSLMGSLLERNEDRIRNFSSVRETSLRGFIHMVSGIPSTLKVPKSKSLEQIWHLRQGVPWAPRTQRPTGDSFSSP